MFWASACAAFADEQAAPATVANPDSTALTEAQTPTPCPDVPCCRVRRFEPYVTPDPRSCAPSFSEAVGSGLLPPFGWGWYGFGWPGYWGWGSGGWGSGGWGLAAGVLAAGALAAGGLEAGVLLGVHSAITRTPSASTAAFGFHAVRVGLTHLSRTGSTAAQDSSPRCHCRSTHFIRSHLLTAPDREPALGRRAWASIIGSPRGAFQPNKTVERNSFRSGREKDLESD